jgi:hypothetical protein
VKDYPSSLTDLLCGHRSHAGVSRLVEFELDFIDIAPTPVFAGLVGFDDGMVNSVEVLRRVLVLRGVAAADMAASHAEAQVNPCVAHFQTFFAAVRVRFHMPDLIHVSASHDLKLRIFAA